MKIHGRQGFKDSAAISESANLNIVTKMKKMARRKRYASGLNRNRVEMDAGNEVDQNEANEELEVMDDDGSVVSDELPGQLDVSQLLAYTALPPMTPELPRGDDKRARVRLF